MQQEKIRCDFFLININSITCIPFVSVTSGALNTNFRIPEFVHKSYYSQQNILDLDRALLYR